MYNSESHAGSDDTQGYDASPVEYVPFGSLSPALPAAEALLPTLSPLENGEGSSDAEVTAPGYFTTPIEPPAAPAPHKRRRNFWVAAGLLAALLLVGLASFAVVLYLNRSTPARTLDAFCSALQHENYQLAYNQMSSQLQAQLPEHVLATALAQDKVIVCTYGTTSEAGSSTTTSLLLKHQSNGINSDRVTLVKEQDNNWKIDNLQKA